MLRPFRTFDQVIRAESTRTTGFDYLRIGLALGVVCVHAISIADHHAWTMLWTSWTGPFERSILPSFFVLSGFLVSGSLLRNPIPQFLTLRAIRLLPALAVEITLSAIVLGFIFTTMPLYSYISSSEFHSYFLNIVGIIHFSLPGVFDGEPLNLQLWTIPFELECYIFLVFLFMIRLVKYRVAMLCLLFLTTFILTTISIYFSWYEESWNVPGRMLVLSFLFGVACYRFKDKIPHSSALLVAALFLSFVLQSFPNLVFLAAAPLSYVTVYVGLLRLPAIPFGDLSYGVFLFHFPIARSLHELSGRSMPWEMLLPATIVGAALFAALSWNFVEKPALDRKDRVLASVEVASKWSSRCLSRLLRRIPAKA